MDIQFQEIKIPKNESSSLKIPQTIKRSAQKVSSLQGAWSLFKKNTVSEAKIYHLKANKLVPPPRIPVWLNGKAKKPSWGKDEHLKNGKHGG